MAENALSRVVRTAKEIFATYKMDLAPQDVLMGLQEKYACKVCMPLFQFYFI